MKNIHLLQTDQPTGIFETNSGLQFSIMNKVRYGEFKGFHIYLTSNEEIKEGDWFLSDFNSFPLHNIKEFSERKDSLGWKQEDLKNNLKIILTTDPTLILNGVQAIDDEFLEWFVQNPICEYVEVKSYWKLLGNDYEHNGYATLFYESISRYVKEEPKQELPTYEESIQHILTAHKIPKELFGQEEPKQETLEEAAERNGAGRFSFIAGAKYMAKKMYSEEEVKAMIEKALTHNDYEFCGSLVTAWQEIRTANFGIWFEENKKK